MKKIRKKKNVISMLSGFTGDISTGCWFDYFREDFIIHDFFASRKLLIKYTTAVGILERNHCTPDGLLFKLKETGRMKRTRENASSSTAKLRIYPRKRGRFFELPIVEGDLEAVEIECGRNAKLMGKQKETYNSLIAKVSISD